MIILKTQKETGKYIEPKALKIMLVGVNKKYNKNLKTIPKRHRNKNAYKRSATPKIPDELADFFWTIANKLINRPNFINYWHLREEMINRGFQHLYEYTRNYQPTKGSAFGYCTKICWHAYVQVINESKRYANTIEREKIAAEIKEKYNISSVKTIKLEKK